MLILGSRSQTTVKSARANLEQIFYLILLYQEKDSYTVCEIVSHSYRNHVGAQSLEHFRQWIFRFNIRTVLRQARNTVFLLKYIIVNKYLDLSVLTYSNNKSNL